jgi:RsiW-degrading membrane proteinase PrsW (M82 family)
MILKACVSLIPVFLLLLLLVILDSMKLVSKRLLLLCLLWGIVSAVLSFFLNTFLIRTLDFGFNNYSSFVAPFVEEGFKLGFLWMLIRRNRIGFMIDAAIYGFSIGAAFAFSENLFYLFRFAGNEGNLMVWIIRGFGTAVMHGGSTALFGILCMGALNRKSGPGFAALTGALASIVFHGLFNLFLLSPVISTSLILVIIPVSILLVFHMNEKSVRNWLELEFDSEVSMLRMIRVGRFAETRTGQFLMSVRHHFSREVVFDLYCYISLYLELSMKAKAHLMLRENDLAVPSDPVIAEKLKELKALERTIGKSGLLAISPVLRMSRKDLWKLALLGSENNG